MTLGHSLIPALLAGLLSWLGAWRLIRVLGRRGVLDRPNERSLHSNPTPRGGGIAVVAATLLAWAAVLLMTGAAHERWAVPLAALALAMLSWRDDVKGLPVRARLAGHVIAVAVGLWSMPGLGALFGPAVPQWLAYAVLALAWVWFVNLFNFMDGIDGLAGGEALGVGLGVAAVAWAAGLDGSLGAMGLSLAAASLGFLLWNWQPARIFLGDVGSVPLGFLLGFLLLRLAEAGQWAAALLLPLYFLADASITLARRALKGEQVWQAHKQHFYQRAVAKGMSHALVASLALVAGAVLIGAAILSAQGLVLAGLALGFAAVAALLWWMGRR